VSILKAVIAERGDNAETCALLGRIYKDYYKEALDAADRRQARSSLETAIEWYRRGFNADPRDTYPGINLATLLVLEGSESAQKEVVRVAAALSFALARLQALSSTDYWTLATVLECAVLDNDWDTADRAMGRALNAEPSLMQLETTCNNLRLILGAQPPHIDRAQLEALVADFAGAVSRSMGATAPA
jgi:MAP3K TRAFs-binding domain